MILGVSYDSPEINSMFREKFDFPYDLLSDEDHGATVAYGVADPDAERSPRKSVLISPDRKIAFAYDSVTPADHPSQVIEDLDRLK